MFSSSTYRRKNSTKITSLKFFILSVFCLSCVLPTTAQEVLSTAEKAGKGPRTLPTYQELLETTYLGHTGELPEPEEPVEVLLLYLEQGRHRPDPQSDRAAANREVAEWKHLANRYRESRYAHFGLGRAYRNRASLTGSVKDLQNAGRSFLRANEIGLTRGRIVYTREISEVLAQLREAALLDNAFAPILALGPGLARKEFFMALVDYADGLAELEDDRAWPFFEEALELYPIPRIEGINRYASRLLQRGRAREALDMIEARLPREERVRFATPAVLRKQALEALGRDTSSADGEIQEIRLRRPPAGTAATAAFTGGLEVVWQEFVHSNATDDCRSATYAQNLHCASSGFCYYSYEVNLAEILWNEARGESLGGQDMVGWTVRDRAFQRVSCDAYPGGTTSTTCRSTVPCSDPSNCTVSRNYCCVEHGGTTTVGATQFQFNDAHVTLSNLESAGLLNEAYYIIQGYVPEPSTNFIPPGVSGCTTGCGGWCTSGSNLTSPAPQGPMEFRANNYCAAASSCKWYAKNVCGNNPVPSSCSTGGNSGDNHFWNRLN